MAETIENRLREAWLKHSGALPGKASFETSNYGNDFHWMIELSNGWRFAMKKEVAIPEGGLSDSQIFDLTAKVVDGIATQMLRQRIKQGAPKDGR